MPRHRPPKDTFAQFPFEETPRIERTMTFDQFRLSLQVCDLGTRDVAHLFSYTRQAVQGWGKYAPVPAGVADWLRLRVESKLRALATAVDIPIMMEGDSETPPTDKGMKALNTLRELMGERAHIETETET